MKTILLLLFFTFQLSVISLGANKGIQIVSQGGQQVGSYENSYALLVGVSDYTNGWPDLNAIPRELNQVESLLKAKGFNTTLVMNPDGKSLESTFNDFVDDYGLDPNNRLLFYFSGHGYTRQNNSKGYLVPTDAPDPRLDEKNFVRKAYSMTSLLALARNIEAHHALFLFDSCFSGTIFKTRALPNEPPLITALTSKPVRQFITAGDAGEEVPAKSVFTPAFIEALEYGTGDLNGDGYVTGSELGMHLQSEVSIASHQTPQYGKISDFELSRGDYVFVSMLNSPGNVRPSIGQETQTTEVNVDLEKSPSPETIVRQQFSKKSMKNVIDCTDDDSGFYCQGCVDEGNNLGLCRTQSGGCGSCSLNACLHAPKYDAEYNQECR